MKYLTSNSFANPFISACNGFFLSPGNTFKMQIKAYENDSRNECNLLDLHNLLFKFIDGNVDEPFRKFQSLHVSAKIGNLSNVAPNTNLSSVFAVRSCRILFLQNLKMLQEEPPLNLKMLP
jgi:hypothetical protein